MANDPVLALHRVEGHKYELSGLRTGSVRDQLLRAQLIVQRLTARKIIEGRQRPLLVAGGGAAGIAAAIEAAARGIDVVVLELDPNNPFQTQLNVTTRHLNPTEFDWPQHHWTHGRIDWATSHVLPYVAKRASRLAAEWTTVLHGLTDPLTGSIPSGFGLLQVLVNIDARKLSYNAVNGVVEVTGLPALGGSGVIAFGAVISCVGFSGEKTSIKSTKGTFVGPKFWSSDRLRLPRLGLGRRAPNPIRVLVSGGGDGAQQDFLRVLTGQFGTSLFQALKLDKLALDLTQILIAEAFALRAHSWADLDSQPPERAYEQWHKAYVDLADFIWSKWTNSEIEEYTKLLRPDIQATWVMGGQVPGFCYGLNRLLALLVAKLHAESTKRIEQGGHDTAGYTPSGREVILAGCRLHHVEPIDDHTCDDQCNGRPHIVFVTGDGRLVYPGPHKLGRFDFLIVRHGVLPKPLFTPGAPISEQLVPMDFPL